jgi:hypothetical protein
VETDNGAVVRAMKSTYKRNGTLNLSAALEIASGHVHAQTTEQKKREDFRRFSDPNERALLYPNIDIFVTEARR